AALFAAFAAMPGLEARYTEEKHLALLAVPLTSAGRLYFLQPGYLARVVEKPEPSKLLITPDKLRMADRDGVEVIDLQQSERLRLFVTSLVRVFRGDRAALTEHYSIEYTPSPDDPAAWTLALAPKRAPLDHMMKSLTLRGKGVAVTGFELVEPNGDRTVTKIIAADPEREFSVAEKTELFGIEVGERAR
ncbi:MAG: outer membrane lipoprotein carrier protein LolA, partial [Planctomycetes bacterium]|nr:outer membrane lipoprotein carrier protein LolA [Planctomycetota bacterium]